MSDVPIDQFGADGVEQSARSTDEKTSKPFLFSARVWALSIWASIVFFALVAALVWHAFRTPILESYDAKAIFVAATTLLWLPLILLLLNSQDNFSKGPRTALPIVSLTLLSTLTALVVYDYATDGSLLSGSVRSFGQNYAVRFHGSRFYSWDLERLQLCELRSRASQAACCNERNRCSGR